MTRIKLISTDFNTFLFVFILLFNEISCCQQLFPAFQEKLLTTKNLCSSVKSASSVFYSSFLFHKLTH